MVFGRKRFWLVPPEEEVPRSAHPFWAAPFDLDRTDRAIREVVLEPGQLLSIPAGWWHATEALEPHLSVSMATFDHTPNDFRWFAASRN